MAQRPGRANWLVFCGAGRILRVFSLVCEGLLFKSKEEFGQGIVARLSHLTG